MRATVQWGWGAGLAVAIGLAGFHSSAAPSRGQRPAFNMRVRNYAGVTPRTLGEAERAATAVFQKAGIETSWAEIEVSDARAGFQDQPMTLADVQVNIFSDTAPIPAGVSDSVMGVAPGVGPDRTVVDVFEGRVRALFWRMSSAYFGGNRDRFVPEGQLLGHVIAHEAGHLLLNQQGHSPRGIMRGEWTFADFRDMASGSLLFTPQQAQALLGEVARRSAHERIDVAAAKSLSTAH